LSSITGDLCTRRVSIHGRGINGVSSRSQVHLYALPALSHLVSHPLGCEVIPRSVLLATFEDIPYLLCALGDGQLFNFHVDPIR